MIVAVCYAQLGTATKMSDDTDDLIDEIYQREKWPFSAPPMELRKGVCPELDQLLDRSITSVETLADAAAGGNLVAAERVRILRREAEVL